MIVRRPPAVEVSGLEKRYGEVEAVRGVDFQVEAGETFGFLGPNGAGKSTTINILCTLTSPTAGVARVAGHDVTTDRDDVRRTIGLVFQDPTLDQDLTAEQNLRFHAELYGVPKAAVADRIDDMLGMVGLTDRRRGAGAAPSPAACAVGSRSPAGCCTRLGCSSWTSRRSAWTRRAAPRCGSTSGRCATGRTSPSS